LKGTVFRGIGLLVRGLKKLDQILAKGEALILGFLLSLMTIVVFLQVIFRYILDQPLSWSEEMARYLFVWLSILGAALGVQKKGHFGLDFFQRMMPERLKGVLGQVIQWLMIMVTLIILYQGIILVRMTRPQESPAMALSMAWAYSALPVGAGLMTFHLLTALITMLGRDKQRDKAQEGFEPGV
jgi:TRAP-type C4-dicarboxylate transport system permease small subunit